jgi:hypothetical protein
MAKPISALTIAKFSTARIRRILAKHPLTPALRRVKGLCWAEYRRRQTR